MYMHVCTVYTMSSFLLSCLVFMDCMLCFQIVTVTVHIYTVYLTICNGHDGVVYWTFIQ